MNHLNKTLYHLIPIDNVELYENGKPITHGTLKQYPHGGLTIDDHGFILADANILSITMTVNEPIRLNVSMVFYP